MIMKAENREFDLDELSRETGFTVRTIRYYIQRGLLPSPGTGRGLKYGEEYLDRLKLIRQLQKQHFPLDDIKKNLDGMSWSKVSQAIEQAPVTRSSAADYINSVLGSSKVESANFESTKDYKYASRSASITEADKITWDRYELSDDIELHVKRPGSRERNRQIERIIAAAQRILKE
jgi:DNA-binding transcriptional MerR regulator